MVRLRNSGAVLTLFLVATIMPVHPQEAEDKRIELTLEEVIHEVVRSNPSVKEARIEWLIASRSEKAAWGDFVPDLVAGYTRSSEYRESTVIEILQQNFETELAQDRHEYSTGIQGLLFTGTSYQFGLSVTKIENSLTQDGEYQSFLGFSAEQPLLKGATSGAPLAPIRVARQETAVAYQEYRRQLMSVVSQAESAYWNLVYAQQRLELARSSTSIARLIAEDTKARRGAGRASELDTLEADAGVAVRRAQQADAEQNLIEASSQLLILLGSGLYGDRGRVVALDRLLSRQPEATGDELRAISLEWALRAHPDLLVRRRELERETIVYRYQKDQALPELNLTASYGLNGLGDTVDQSLSNFQDRTYTSWSVGLNLRIPLPVPVRQKNELAVAALRRKLADQRLATSYYEIRSAIDSMILRISTLQTRIENAQRVADAKSNLLDVEMQRLAGGRSDIRRVLQVEEELAQAKQLVLESAVRYREAQMQLAFVRGSVLRDLGLEQIGRDGITWSGELQDLGR